MYNYPYGDNQQINLNWIINEIIALHQRLDPDYTAPTFTQIYPFSETQQLNLDWILAELKTLKELAPTPPPTELIDEIGQALIAGAYDADTSYQKNDYIVQDGKVYRANAATTGTFDPTKWNEVMLGNDLAIITRWADATNTFLNSLAASNVANDSSVTGTTVKDALDTLKNTVPAMTTDNVTNESNVTGATATAALNNLNSAINTLTSERLILAPAYYGATDLDTVVNYALGLSIFGKPFAFQAIYTTGNTGFFNVSAFTAICFFSSVNYGYGLMFSDQTNAIALFRRAASVNLLVPIAHTSQITDNVQFLLNSANKAYSIGECFTYNGDLYRVTAPISSESPITIGTNAVKTTLDTAIQDNYTFDNIPFVAAAGVSSNASFDRTGNMLSGVGYISVTTAVSNGGNVGSVAQVVRKRQQFVCVNINNHDAFAIYYNTDGTITAPEGLAVGYYRIIGPIII